MKFIGSRNSINSAKTVLIGIPFDATSSFRSGSRFAPNSIRLYSDSLETYSPVFDSDIEDLPFYDYGDIFVTINNFKKLSENIEEMYPQLIKQNKKILSIGGEHLITYPILLSYKKMFPDLKIIHIDAHADLRDNYLGEKFSHATVIRRISEFINPDNIFQFGIRSGTREEFEFAEKNTNFFPFNLSENINILKKIQGEKVYVTLDLDVLDPSIFPGTGTPEPGGVFYKELEIFLKHLYNLDIIGGDVVELLPDNDRNGISSIVAAKIIRELIIIMNK